MWIVRAGHSSPTSTTHSTRPCSCHLHSEGVPKCLSRYACRHNGYTDADYLTKSRDPLVPNTWLPRYAWFRMSLLSEFMLQVPAFLVGLYAFWYSTFVFASLTTKDDARAYPFLIAYGAIGTSLALRCLCSACFTTLQCIAMVTIGEERVHISEANLLFILQYVSAPSARILQATGTTFPS